jgi:catechol 2,3-dioxygenase-like lactoylglutathione lyase family enzyme
MTPLNTAALASGYKYPAPRTPPISALCLESVQSSEVPVSDQEVRMVVLSTDNLAESIKFYTETLGFPLKFRDGAHFAALDGGSVTLALATAIDHPIPGQVVVGIKTDDVDGAARAIEENGGGIVNGPYDDAHERRAVVYDNKGNGLVFYKSLPR